MKRWLLTPAVALALAALVHAAPQVEADPNKDYPITPQAGTWVVVVANYTGADATNLARQLVYEVRSKHNCAAYVWNLGDKERAQMKAEEERWKQQHPGIPFKHWRIEDQCGVMIGGFDDMESARAFMMKTVREWKELPALKLPGGKPAYDMEVRYDEGPNGQLKLTRVPVNPFEKSFVSRNPALGPAPKKADPFLKTLNEGEEFNLLKCPEPWTLAVQEYGGATMFVEAKPQKERSVFGKAWDALWGSDDDKRLAEQLNAAAATAHEAAKVLRKFGFDAYVLHTRNSSLVTVGGFKSADDPAMKRTAERLAELKLDAQMKLVAAPYQIPRP
jgi:hypothetical protein